MTNLLYFSDYIRPAISKIRFAWIVVSRFLGLLFSKDKQLVQLQLAYQRGYQFDQSFLVIRYRFKHALWYHFEGIKKTTDDGVISLNLRNIPQMPVTLTVHGFYQKMTCLIHVVPEICLQTKAFRTSISNTYPLQNNQAVVAVSLPEPLIPEVSLKCPAPERLSANIKIIYPSFP